MAAAYLHTSAIAKLILEEAESPAMSAFLATSRGAISSALAIVKVGRAVLRSNATGCVPRAAAVLKGLTLLALHAGILDRAAVLPPTLRSLDAIHLASALSLPDLRDFVTYDRRLAEAARAAGLRVWSPGAGLPG